MKPEFDLALLMRLLLVIALTQNSVLAQQEKSDLGIMLSKDAFIALFANGDILCSAPAVNNSCTGVDRLVEHNANSIVISTEWYNAPGVNAITRATLVWRDNGFCVPKKTEVKLEFFQRTSSQNQFGSGEPKLASKEITNQIIDNIWPELAQVCFHHHIIGNPEQEDIKLRMTTSKNGVLGDEIVDKLRVKANTKPKLRAPLIE